MISMACRLSGALAAFGLVGACHSAIAQMRLPLTNLPAPSITALVRVVRESCYTQDRRVMVKLNVNPGDVGRPGVTYVGVHDEAQTAAYFLSSGGGWSAYGGSMFQPFTVMRDGLQTVTLTFIVPAMYNDSIPGWHLYVGYGALSVSDEAMVQKAIEAVAYSKAKMPERQIPTFDPDHLRLSLVQKDMTEKYKYLHVLQWNSPELVNAPSVNGFICEER